MKKALRKPYRIKRKKSIFHNRLFWLGVLILVIAGTAFYYLFFSETFQVKKIIITGKDYNPPTASSHSQSEWAPGVSMEELELLIDKNLEKKISFFDTKNIFLVDFNQINKIVLANFPQIAKASFGRQLPDKIKIEIEERRPAAIFIYDKNYFLLDKEGIIFEKINEENETELLKIKNFTLNQDLKLGERVIEKEKVDQIMKINSGLINLNLKILEASLMTEKRLNLKTEEGWEIYFNLEKDLDWSLTQLKLVLEEKISPERYIDLRFEKLYYK